MIPEAEPVAPIHSRPFRALHPARMLISVCMAVVLLGGVTFAAVHWLEASHPGMLTPLSGGQSSFSGQPVVTSGGACPAGAQSTALTQSVELSDLAMVSPTEGWAVGGLDHFGTGTSQSVLLHLVNGQWVTVHDLDATAGITSLAMTSATDGWATISALNSDQFRLAHYDGQHWTTSPMPTGFIPPPDGGTYFGPTSFQIRMAAPDDGWVMPFQVQHGGNATLLHYDGTAWRLVQTPFVSDNFKFYQFFDMSVAGPDDLWIVGNYTDDSGSSASGQTMFIAHDDHGQWSQVAHLGTGSLQTIAMRSSADGWIFGQNGSGQEWLAYHYDGTAWKPATPPASSGGESFLNGLTSGPDGSYWAISAATSGSHLLHLVNGHWQATAIPFPPGSGNLPLFPHTVVPLADGDVWVVGDLSHQRGCAPAKVTDISQGAILHLHNGHWSAVVEPVS